MRQRLAAANEAVALWLTLHVGSMSCAVLFAALACVALPQAIQGGTLAIVQWVSQTFIQLVMLSVIMVGQSLLGARSDARHEETLARMVSIEEHIEALLNDACPEVHEALHLLQIERKVTP